MTPTSGRIVPILAAAALVLGAAGGARPAGTDAAEPRPSACLGALRAPAFPGEAALGLRYFRLSPASGDTVLRVLAVPVRFPEDGDLGVSRTLLARRLQDTDTLSLASYYAASTGGRLRLEVHLAPTVTAPHERYYYTAAGEGNSGYGIDPDAYPHNAQGLVDDVTARLADRVDFLRYDNTSDGIADALLFLHSGPPTPEIFDSTTPADRLVAHAFTTPEPRPRRDALIFPYAIASTRDAVGAWAHELGHLLGLPDQYRANALCFDEGTGRWSLMATGSNLFPVPALDAFSRLRLGVEAVLDEGRWIPLRDGAIVRAYAPARAGGSRYFLVERQVRLGGEDEDPAVVVFAVDEDAGDNRSCLRQLVQVRAVLCPGAPECAARLDDTTVPDLRDALGQPTGLVLEFSGDSVRVSYRLDNGMRLLGARLLDPVADAGGMRLPVEVTVRSETDAPVRADLRLAPLPGSGSCPVRAGTGWPRMLAPGATVRDTSWALGGCVPGDPPAPEATPFVFELGPEGGGSTSVDTLVLAPRAGLDSTRWEEFTSRTLLLGRADPWRRDGGEWVAGPLGNRADGELSSPWFTVPADARLLLDHAWDLDLLSPDIALDAAEVRLIPQKGPAVRLAPPPRWGFTVEPGVGNALAGRDVLSGRGDRIHVLDLSPWAGETVRLSLRVSGDAFLAASTWRVRRVLVLPAAAARFTFEVDAGPPRRLRLVPAPGAPGGAPSPGLELRLYGGGVATTPVTEVAVAADPAGFELGLAVQEHRGPPGLARRFEAVWEDPVGRAGSAAITVSVDAPLSLLRPPAPNPTAEGEGQRWRLGAPPAAVAGLWRLALVTVSGRALVERCVEIGAPGEREVRWDGRDDAGRVVGPGVYYLRARRPDGAVESRPVIVVP